MSGGTARGRLLRSRPVRCGSGIRRHRRSSTPDGGGIVTGQGGAHRPYDDPDRRSRRARRHAGHPRSRPCAPRRPAAPRGPGQAHGRRPVHRRHRGSRGVVRRDDPLDRRARDVRRPRSRPGVRLVEGGRRHRRRHPRRERRELDQERPADPRPDRRGDPPPRRAAGPHRRARSHDPARGAPAAPGRGPRGSPASSTPRRPSTRSRAT